MPTEANNCLALQLWPFATILAFTLLASVSFLAQVIINFAPNWRRKQITYLKQDALKQYSGVSLQHVVVFLVRENLTPGSDSVLLDASLSILTMRVTFLLMRSNGAAADHLLES